MEDMSIIETSDFPPLLREIDDPPEKLFVRGKLPSFEMKWLCVVGSRKYSSYGKEACQKLISGLAGYPIVIVSGLALGIDGLAHSTALDVGLPCVAVPGSGLSDKVLHPKTNYRLAKKILSEDGALLSEYEPDFSATPWSFPKRNRIMAGLSNAVLLVEAEEKSGTLITARLASEYNRDVLVVPGSIFTKNQKGVHQFLKLGARPVTESVDILEVLGIEEGSPEKRDYSKLSESEKRVVEELSEPTTKDELIEKLGMNTSQANILLSTMEIKGIIKEEMGKIRLN